MNLEKLYETTVYMAWKLEALKKALLHHDVDSMAKVLEGVAKLVTEIDKAAECGKGYDKLHWLNAKQLKELIQPKQVNEMASILFDNLFAFSDDVEEERDKLAEMYQSGIVDEDEVKSTREWICEITAELAYLTMGMQCMLQALGSK